MDGSSRRSVAAAIDRRGADFIGVGEGGGLARHPAQAEARRIVIIGRLEAAVIEAKCLAQTVLEIKFAVVVPRQVTCGEGLRLGRVKRPIEERPGGVGHSPVLE